MDVFESPIQQMMNLSDEDEERLITDRKELCLPNAWFMIHRPPGGTSGQASDIDIQPKEINMMKKCQDEILVKHTGQPKEVIEKDTDRDFFLTGEEAVEYGLIDRTVRQLKELQCE